MIPIRDHNPTRVTPLVTYGLIIVNVVVFLSYAALPERQLELVYAQWAMVPAWITQGEQTHTLLTHMFMHASLLHLGGNMLFLYIFGDNLEDFLGHGGFMAFYLVGGLAGAALQIASDPASPVPNVGASGAIAGVMGGYLLLHPRARIDVLPIIFLPWWVVPVPAVLLLAIWFALQLLGGFSTPVTEGGVAYWAHAGGFVAGVAMIGLMLLSGRRPTPIPRRAPDRPPVVGRRAGRRRGPWG